MKEGLALSDTPVYSFFFLGPFIVCVKLRREIEARICDTNLGLKTKIENWGSQFSAAGKKISGSADLKLCSFQRRDQTSRRRGLLLNLWKKWENRVLLHKSALHILHHKEIEFQLETFSPHCTVENHQK